MIFKSNSEKVQYYKTLKKKRNTDKALNHYKKNREIISDRRSRNTGQSASKSAVRKRRQRESQKQKIQKRKLVSRNSTAKWRQRKQNTLGSNIGEETPLKSPNRMFKSRAVKSLKSALKTPLQRLCAIKGYLKSKSPTVKHVKKSIQFQNENVTEESLIDNMKEYIHGNKNERNMEARSTMNILTAAISGDNLKSKTNISKKLGIRLRRLQGGQRIRHQVLKNKVSAFELTKRKTRCDKTPDSTKKLIYEFWMSPEVSRTTGNKRDIKRQRLGPKTFVSQPIQVLEKTQTEVYIQFKSKYNDIKISQRQFESFKPFFVVPVRRKDRATCCCKQHVETRGLFRRVMEHRRALLKTGQYNEEDFPVYEHLNDLIESTMCERQGDEFEKKCIERECNLCGVDRKFKTMDAEIENSDDSPDVNWEKFEYITYTIKNRTSRKLSLVKKCTKAAAMMSHFKKLINDFSAHQFRATWQNRQFRTIADNLPQNHALCVHDFSENFRCSEKVEIQSNYFQRTEVTIHVSIIYRHSILEVDGEDSVENDPSIVIEQFFVISDDTTHDRHFTYYVQQEISDYLKSINANINVMHEFTDGCSVQYKSRNCMSDVCNKAEDLGYSQVIRNFYETSHAKGAQDAAGGFVKSQADFAILRGTTKIRTAHDLYEYAQNELQFPKSGIYKRRVFRYVCEIPRKRIDDFSPVAENHKLHQVMSTGRRNHLIVRKLSCYECDTCITGKPETCSNTELIGESKAVELTLSKKYVGEVIDIEPRIELRTLITPGSLVAVFTDDGAFEYYLLKVTESPAITKNAIKDDWNVSFPQGSDVVKGLYYDRVNDSGDFKLIRKKVAIVYTIAVTYVCVELSAKININVPEQLHTDIISSLDNIVEF